ncbi:MAG: hypothetical protein RL021_282, partial [Bacteroidota bacterium]
MVDIKKSIKSFNRPSFLSNFAVTLLIISSLIVPFELTAQFNPNCTGGVPTYNVDFTGNPQGTFEILNEIRAGNCCRTVSPDRCLRI